MASQVNCVITRGHMIAYISDVLCSYLFVLCVNYSGECGHEAHVCVWLNVLLFFPYYLSLTFFNIGVTGHSGWLQTQYQCLNIYWLRRKQHMATRWYSWTCGQNAVIDTGRQNTKYKMATTSCTHLLSVSAVQWNLCRLTEAFETTILCFF